MNRTLKCCALFALAVLSGLPSSAQSSAAKKKYPSLLWEITGNGMKRPSYLFGTMHISNKMVFHLPDSFYNAIKSVDVVALELSPDLWQADIPRMNRQSEAYQRFASGYSDDYIHQNTFTESSFIPQLQRALSTEPALNNSLLYRADQSQEDFQENTYLDLYIYQTGRKLGKSATGVESFMGSQRMAVEAYVDAAMNKSKKRNSSGMVNSYEILQATQDAYRNGDLDALDSLDDLTEQNEAFTEKFLYRRNDIQAHSMDSIMHHQALFVGVGAAHLPGKRGVIEILRRKGYKLRPVKMQDRDAAQKDIIDSLRVPVNFTAQWAEDSAYRVAAPGPLQPLQGGSQEQMDYADMANGSYYLITRIKTHPLFTGTTPARALRVADSLFYEAIPGKILSKKPIEKDGAKGYEITNRTRRGDIQRYEIFAMPSETIIFKMGGTENYVAGPEADTFFNSIRLKNYSTTAGYQYGPKEGGYRITFPQKPVAQYEYRAQDGEPRTTAEATNTAGESFVLMKKDIYSFQFLDKDTFCASLGIESALNGVAKSDILGRKSGTYKDYASADAIVRAKNGQFIHYRSIVQGPQQFLLAARTTDRNSSAVEAFFNSLSFLPTAYGAPMLLQDTFLKLEVRTPIALRMDADVAALVAYSRTAAQKVKTQSSDYATSPEERKANFFSESTGELVTVETATFPGYYYVKKGDTFWDRELSNATNDSDMVIQKKEKISMPDGTTGYSLTISDTGSSRLIRRVLLLKGLTLYTFQAEVDSKMGESDFVKTFLSSVKPYGVASTPTVTDSKSARFFADYYSKDSITHARAVDAIPSVYFGTDGYPKVVEAISRLKPGSAEYYTLKPKFIRELGYLSDSTNDKKVLATLKDIYNRSGDTSWIQNEVLTAIQHLQTGEATTLFRQLLLQDPPVFDDESDYAGIFSTYEDTLKLGAQLFPDVLQLVPIADFKPSVISLLAKEVDSGYVKPEAYQSMASNIAFDAKIALKKELSSDESTREAAAKRAALDEDEEIYTTSRSLPANDTSRGMLYDYAVLLAPFYNQNPAIPRFFDKLLSVSTPETRLQTALLLKRYKQPVTDSIWRSLASDKLYRSRLYDVLKRAAMLQYYPGAAPTQEELVRGRLYAQVTDIKTLKLVGKRQATVDGESGILYAYQYRKRGSDEDQIALNGPQPADPKQYNADPKLSTTGIALKKTGGTEKQIADLLDRSRISFQPAGRQFYNGDGGSEDAFLRMMQQYRGRGEE